MINLVIDIGNTLAKVALFSKEFKEPHCFQFASLKLNDIQKLFEQYSITHSIVSNVGNCKEPLLPFLRKNSQYVDFTFASKLSIVIAYQHPESLGLDRIANVVAVSDLFPGMNVLAIQAGSCIVTDFIDKNGVYHGGSISPGMAMRFKALHHYTEKLPSVEMDKIDFFTGNDTQQSIKSGVINGVIYEINGFINSYKQVFPDVKVVLTGGDSGYLKNSIKNKTFAASNLVLYGLNKILIMNV